MFPTPEATGDGSIVSGDLVSMELELVARERRLLFDEGEGGEGSSEVMRRALSGRRVPRRATASPVCKGRQSNRQLEGREARAKGKEKRLTLDFA